MAGLENIQLPNQQPNFGNRLDGTPKGTGFFGMLPMQDGSNNVATEMSTSFDYGNGDTLVPLINPLLNQDELNHLLQGKEPTKEIQGKAGQWGLQRLQQGRSPFLDDTDQQQGLAGFRGN